MIIVILSTLQGKVGAFIGTYTFPQIQASFGKHGQYAEDTGVFYLGSALALVSALITLIFIPNIQPDAMHDEDIAFREYLEANGFDTSKWVISALCWDQ